MSRSVVDAVVKANRILANEGVFEGYGHVSARAPDGDEMLIARSRSPKLVTEDDVVRMAFDGSVVGDEDVETYTETVIHRAIYRRRDDVHAVVHHHADAIMPFAASERELRPVYRRATQFHAGIPRFSDYDPEFGLLVVGEAEGDRMAENLGDSRAQLLEHHGANVVGTTVEEAVLATLDLVKNAEYQYRAEQLGEVSYYAPDRRARESYLEVVTAESTVERKWEYLVSELPEDS